MECGNMWYNPKLPKWARDIKGGAAALAERQQAAERGSLRLPKPVARRSRFAKKGSSGIGSAPSCRRRPAPRTPRSRAASASGRRSSRRERAAAKKRDDAAAALAEKNKPLGPRRRARGGRAGLVDGACASSGKPKTPGSTAQSTFDAASGKHAVAYDDGDEQTRRLRGSSAAALRLLARPGEKTARKSAVGGGFGAATPGAPARQRAREREAARGRPPLPAGASSGATAYARPRPRGGSDATLANALARAIGE